MLTLTKVKIYNKYGGDIDRLARSGKSAEQYLITDNDWSQIDKFMQDVELICNKLVSKDYRRDALKKIRKECDEDALEYFLFKIPFYEHFQEISEIIFTIKSKVNNKTDTAWTGFDTPKELLKELEFYQSQLDLLDFDILEQIKADFLPTASFQELSIQNGWSEEYIRISRKFDLRYSQIKGIEVSRKDNKSNLSYKFKKMISKLTKHRSKKL